MADFDQDAALHFGTARLRLAGHEPADQLAGAVLLAITPLIRDMQEQRDAAEAKLAKIRELTEEAEREQVYEDYVWANRLRAVLDGDSHGNTDA